MFNLQTPLFSVIPTGFLQKTINNTDHWFSQWYRRNGVFKFPIGTAIALTDMHYFGYGIRPISIITGHTINGNYEIDMSFDMSLNVLDWLDWVGGAYIPRGRRITKKEVHFKWYIELHFKKCLTSDASEVYKK